MKAYWVCVYEKILNEKKLNEYALKAKPAVEKFSGKIDKSSGGSKSSGPPSIGPCTAQPDIKIITVRYMVFFTL